MLPEDAVGETHGCIVCGKLYTLLVVYAPDGRFVDCAVTSGDAHPVVDEHKPLVACDRHTDKEIETALARRKAALSGVEED